MSQLRIELLGTFQVLQNGRSLTTFRSDKIRGLLAYLAVEAGRPHRRASLAGLLWPEMDDRKALSNLRLSLHRLCQTLGAACAVLQIDRQAVCLDASAVWVDVLDFEQAFTAVSRHNHTRLAECPDCMRQLETAVALYRGDFLPGFFLSETAAFDEWVAARREWLLQKTSQALTWLVAYHAENGRLTQAILYVRRQLELEPWRESAHRQMMQFLAQTNQHAAALHQFDLCQRLLREELGVKPDANTLRLYAQIRAEAAREGDRKQAKLIPLTLSSAQRISINLPATAAPFIGRRAELQLLEQLVTNPSVRLVTIVGVGGMGKTRLAAAFAAAQAAHRPERFPHGITFVPLTAVTTAKYLLPTIAQTLAFMSEPENTTLSIDQQLLSYLQSRQMLLVLDNFEQLLHNNGELDGTAVLLDLIQQAPQLTLLVTSRERLQLKAEHLLLLDGLTYPAEEELKNIDFSANSYAAVQLFQQSARRLQPNFTLTPEDYPHLVTICRLLDGMPLGLELAATWVEWLPLAEIASEIHNSLDFLSTEERDRPDRHRDMRRIFDDSWLRLSQPEQTMFARLAVFHNGFNRAAAKTIASGRQKHTAVLYLLTSLVRKSFLRYNHLTDRYTLHELLRQYAAEQLIQQPDYADVQRQHALYYCHWLQQQAPHLQGEHQKETLKRIAADIENIRTAWEWASLARVPAMLADSAFSLGLFFLRNGRYTEGEALFSAAANQLKTDKTAEKQPLALARLWYWQAVFEPNIVVQQELLQDSLALLENVRAPEKTIWADKAAVLLELGIAAHRQGRHTVVDQAFKQSLTLYRLSDNQWGEGNVLFELGVRAWRKGEYPLSEQWFTHCLKLRQRLGDLVGTAVALEGLVGSAFFSGQIENAVDFLQQSYAVYQQLEDRVGLARLKIKQAQINWYQNLDGLTLFEEGLTSLHELGARRNVALWTVIFAKLIADEDIEKAAHIAADGQKLCQELGHQRGAAVAQGVLSRAALVKGDYREALELAEAYLHAIQTLSVAVEYSDALVWAGWASFALGYYQQAERYVTKVLQTVNYWRVACLDLTAVLLAHRATQNAKWAWQLLGFAERHYARNRGRVAQEILQRFLPQTLLDMPPFEIARLKAEGGQMDEKNLYQQLQTCFEF